MRISKDGGKLEVIATGFRAPNGMCVRADGQITTRRQPRLLDARRPAQLDQARWVLRRTRTLHRTPEPTVTDNPLCWLPYPGWTFLRRPLLGHQRQVGAVQG